MIYTRLQIIKWSTQTYLREQMNDVVLIKSKHFVVKLRTANKISAKRRKSGIIIRNLFLGGHKILERSQRWETNFTSL